MYHFPTAAMLRSLMKGAGAIVVGVTPKGVGFQRAHQFGFRAADLIRGAITMGASAAIAILIRKEKDLVEHFKQAGAMSPSSARSSSALGVHERLAWSRLVRDAVIQEAEPGTYYLDESAWIALGQKRRRIAFILTIFSVALAVAMMIVTWMA